MKMRISNPQDVRYVRENYFTLEELCRRAGLPQASYVLSDGTHYYPAGYLDQRFTVGDFKAAGLDAEDHAVFLEGTYGICLREVTPATIARKAELIVCIAGALSAPHPQDQSWCTGLRAAVDELDSLERPFTQFDREAFGRPVSRDTYITDVRRAFPQAFSRDTTIH